MSTTPKLLNSLDWTLYTIRFIKNNFLVIFSLGLVAAFGRVIQQKAFGPVSPLSHTILEIVVESTRVLLFFFALGLTNSKNGLTKLIQFITNPESRNQAWQLAIRNTSESWPALVANLLAFLLIAFVFNALINHIAHETCLFITLKTRQLISGQSSVWTVILFFKNISVIPFTLTFEAIFFLWITSQSPKATG